MRLLVIRTAVLVCLLVPGTGFVQAAEDAPTDNPAQTARERLEAITRGEVRLDEDATPDVPGEGLDPMRPEAPAAFVQDPETLEKYQQSLRAYYDYRISGLEHRSRVFKWQLFSAKLIFAIVLILVGAGIYFAAVQFYAGLAQDKARRESLPAGETQQGPPTTQTEISASLEGIKISSPVLGVIILTLSLAFFYLYLVYVYPIEDTF